MLCHTDNARVVRGVKYQVCYLEEKKVDLFGNKIHPLYTLKGVIVTEGVWQHDRSTELLRCILFYIVQVAQPSCAPGSWRCWLRLPESSNS